MKAFGFIFYPAKTAKDSTHLSGRGHFKETPPMD
jgi:hypothetical protein